MYGEGEMYVRSEAQLMPQPGVNLCGMPKGIYYRNAARLKPNLVY